MEDGDEAANAPNPLVGAPKALPEGFPNAVEPKADWLGCGLWPNADVVVVCEGLKAVLGGIWPFSLPFTCLYASKLFLATLSNICRHLAV